MEHSQSFYNHLKSVQLAYDLSLSYVRSLYKARIGKWASKNIEANQDGKLQGQLIIVLRQFVNGKLDLDYVKRVFRIL